MKRLILFAIFSAFALAQSDPDLKWLHPSPQGQYLRWVKMFDANNWYAAGERGSFMKTTDAGQTWVTNNRAGWPNSSYPGHLTNWHAYAGWFFDQNNGIIVGSNMQGILRTSDGGETFDTLHILPSGTSTLNNVYFVNSNLGFICGSSTFKVYKTTDGGSTWTQFSNLPSTTYYDVYASDESNIIACGSSGNTYKTTDGGANWATISVGTTNTLYDLEFINSSTGYVSGASGLFRYTTDAGLTWTGTNPPSTSSLYKIKFVSNDVYVAGNATNLYKTTDNGTTWSTIVMGIAGNYTGVNYGLDAVGSNLVVVGALGNMYKSTDAGANWTNLLQMYSYASFIYSIYVENTTGKIIAAGRFSDVTGSIIYSNDGGTTWQASPYITPQANMFNRMQMFNNNEGYFGGDGGFFASTTDGGINLTPISVPPAAGKKIVNLEFLNPSLGWIVGGTPVPSPSGVVAKTTDAGTTWTDQTPPGLSSIVLCIDFVDQNVGYVSSASVYKTTDGGTNWTTINIPGLSGNLNSIKAFDAQNIYAVSSSGQFFKSTDGGANWQLVTMPITISSIFGQEWLDMNNGFLVGTLGVVAKTSDAGATWTIMNTGGWTAYGGHMEHPDTFYVSAGNGQIFKYALPFVPVELSSFFSTLRNNEVTLNWSTATELNNAGFEIERSNDLQNWISLGFTPGFGTTTEPHNYKYTDANLSIGSYYYRIKQIDLDGTYKYYYLGSEIEIGVPLEFSLDQNYPNPFNPSTTISFTITNDSKVTLKVFDILGSEVATLVNEVKKSGRHTVDFNAAGFTSGVYLYRLQAGEFTETKKMNLLK